MNRANLRTIAFLVVFSFFLVLACGKNDESRLEESFLSESDLHGIIVAGESNSYVGNELFDYMNGGAEIYYEYGFEQAYVQSYLISEKKVTVEVFRMTLPAHAYGIYTFDSRGEYRSVGQDGSYEEGILTFWKGNYFVRVFSSDTESEELLMSIGRSIALKIIQTGQKPDIVSYSPMMRNATDSLVYFRGMIALNNTYFLSHLNVLNLGRNVEGMIFNVPAGGKSCKVIILRYPNDSMADEAFSSFSDSHIIKEGIIRGSRILGKSRKGYGGAMPTGNRIGIVLDGESLHIVTDVLASLF